MNLVAQFVCLPVSPLVRFVQDFERQSNVLTEFLEDPSICSVKSGTQPSAPSGGCRRSGPSASREPMSGFAEGYTSTSSGSLRALLQCCRLISSQTTMASLRECLPACFSSFLNAKYFEVDLHDSERS